MGGVLLATSGLVMNGFLLKETFKVFSVPVHLLGVWWAYGQAGMGELGDTQFAQALWAYLSSEYSPSVPGKYGFEHLLNVEGEKGTQWKAAT